MATLDKPSVTNKESKIIEIPTSATIPQMQSSLDDLLNDNWIFIMVFNHNSKTYAVFTRDK